MTLKISQSRRRTARIALGLLALSFLALGGPARAQDTKTNEGGDLTLGGPGAGPGQFDQMRDMAFDARGNFYTLEGTWLNEQTKQRYGNLRVQKFDPGGKPLSQFSLADPALGDKDDPQRLAAGADGSVFVTQPAAGLVQQFGPDGKKMRDIVLPQAMAIADSQQGGQERLAVVPSRHEIVAGHWAWLGGDKIVLLTLTGQVDRTIPLPKPLENVQDIAIDAQGDFYVKAEPNAIYKVSPDGKLLHTFGGNPTTRNPDGSEVLHTVAVDSKGNVYTFTWGNPGLVTRFDADGQTVTQREGQFKWADPWSSNSSYTILAVDPHDRLWVADTNWQDPSGPNYKTYHVVPAVLRVRADFFDTPANTVKKTPVRMLGFNPGLTCDLVENIAYAPKKPVPMMFTVAAANRSVSAIDVAWRAFDAEKSLVAQGHFALSLVNGQPAQQAFAWTPPRFGAYFVQCAMTTGGQTMGALGEHVGVSPRFPQMPVLQKGDSHGGWEDAPRQMWTGLPNMRLHPKSHPLDEVAGQVDGAEKAGAVWFMQITDRPKETTPEMVRAIAARFKDKHPVYEVANEPNFTFGPDDYFKFHKMVYENIKAVDPQARIMGPATVDMNLTWLRRLYDLGFHDVVDIISLHDYEGHESIDPVHWRWKVGEVRKIMAAHGDAAKPLWQTERAIAGVRGGNFQGLVQAIRMTLHRDLWETLGTPGEHNNHYYLNQGGYSDVPTYVWSANGPHPAALALRTRYALTRALGRTYASVLDFGPTGNTYLMGVRYLGTDGQTIALRNLGTRPTPVAFGVRGAPSLLVTDSWGNDSRVPVQKGRATLTLDQLPIYVRLTPQQTLLPPPIDFGRNLAPQAHLTYSSTHKQDMGLLTNGVIETYNAGDPNGDTDGAKIWTGDLPTLPQTLDIQFDQPQKINAVVLRGVRADNGFCALLSYDLQGWDGKAWKTLEAVRRPMPPSEEARTADADHAIWTDDTNLFVHRFAPLTTDRLRVVVHDVTRGFIPDDRALAWGNVIPRKFMLREVEIYAAPNGKIAK